MNKKLIVKQDGYKECGAACLLSIVKYYGGYVSINKILELTNTNKYGTTFYNIKVASSKLGLDSKAFKITNKYDSLKLKKIEMPSICQLIDDNYEHFVVLYKIKNNKVILMDPANGFKTIEFSKFINLWTGYIMLFSKRKKLPLIKEEKYLQKIIIDTIIKNKRIVSNIIILSIFYTVISCIFAMYSGIIIDNIIFTNKNNLLIVTFIFGILLLIKCLASFFRNELFIYLNQKLDCSIFLNAFQKVLLLPYSYYKNRTTGEVISRINDLTYIKNLLNKIILTVFLDLIISFCCAIILIKISSKMFLLLVITIMIYIIIFNIFKKIQKIYTDINQENNAKINSLMIESISGFETIKNLNMESKMNEKMTSLCVNSLNDSFSYDNINNLELFIKDIVTYISILLVEFIGFTLAFNNTLSIGKIITFISLIDYFLSPIRNIIDLNKEYFYAINSLKRANNLFEIKEDNLVSKSNFNISGNIKIKGLSYSYNDYTKILKNININIKKGSKILILGKSGTGKSTILKLLSKYYIPKRNTIYLDEIDINDISISNLKDNITTISQEEIIFTDTIRNNILLDREIEDNNFQKICKLTYVDEIVKDMFLGYDTKLEENGQNISGGQRQRIVLARALLKKSNIVLIDEGLNAIDIDLERKILKNIFHEYKNKTIIIVSHRLENMDLYNQVIKLNNGTIEQILEKPKENNYD
jgi:ATP-binding cassette subfamily B protein